MRFKIRCVQWSSERQTIKLQLFIQRGALVTVERRIRSHRFKVTWQSINLKHGFINYAARCDDDVGETQHYDMCRTEKTRTVYVSIRTHSSIRTARERLSQVKNSLYFVHGKIKETVELNNVEINKKDNYCLFFISELVLLQTSLLNTVYNRQE